MRHSTHGNKIAKNKKECEYDTIMRRQKKKIKFFVCNSLKFAPSD